MVSNIWNKNIPVEKSSYLCDNDITFFNLDGFKHDKNKLTMIDLFCILTTLMAKRIKTQLFPI